MKKVLFLWAFVGLIGFCANAAYAGYTETETTNTYEVITIDTVKYTDAAYIAPRCARTAKIAPCRTASSLDVKKCKCNPQPQRKLKPVRVKTYTEVIDHYQVYQPVVTYKPAGEYTTRRYIDIPNPKFGTCAR